MTCNILSNAPEMTFQFPIREVDLYLSTSNGADKGSAWKHILKAPYLFAQARLSHQDKQSHKVQVTFRGDEIVADVMPEDFHLLKKVFEKNLAR